MQALEKLIKLEKGANDFGFKWPNHQMIIEQAIDECREIKEAIEADEPAMRIQEEIGDLLHTAISLCLFHGFSVEKTLDHTQRKFGLRMRALKDIAAELGLDNLEDQSLDFMLELWRKAKATAGKQDVA